MKFVTYSRQVGLHYIIALILFFVDFFGQGLLFGYLLVIILLFNGKRLISYLDRDFLFLSFFSIVYTFFYLFYLESGVQYIIIYFFFPSFFYLLGKYLVIPQMNKCDLVVLFFVIGVLFAIPALVSIILNISKGGFTQIDREISMFWSGKPIKATLLGAYLTFTMCIPILFLVKQRKIPWILQLVAAGIFIASLLSVFRIGSRTQLVICILGIVFGLVFVVPRQTLKANLKLSFFVFVLGLLVLKFVPLNLDAEYFSVLGSRLQESDNTESAGGRTELWSIAFENLFTKPLGWQSRDTRFAHNLWLDVARFGGLIPLSLLLVFTFRSLINTYKAIKKNRNEILLNTTMFVFTLASMLIFMVEPIMEGLIFLFALFCLFQGMINAYLKQPHVNPESLK